LRKFSNILGENSFGKYSQNILVLGGYSHFTSLLAAKVVRPSIKSTRGA
jgi:hypothetical protein